MNKTIKSIYKFEIIILLLIILLFFIQDYNFKNIISIVVLGLLLFVSTLAFKKKKDTNFFRGSATRIVIAIILFYFIILFLLGLLLGYNRTLFSLNPRRWLTGIVPTFIITLIIEQLRYILIKNNMTEKKAIYGITILLVLFNTTLLTNLYTLNNAYNIFIFLCVTLMPIIAQEMLSSYMVYNYGFLPTITYKLIMNIHLYIIPIMTNLGNYLYSAVSIIIPFTIYMILNKYLQTDTDVKEKDKNIPKINFNFITIPTIIFLIIIIILVSGIFKYQMIAIASNSMVPTYERGDAIILEKVNKKDIDVNDIIVFKKEKKIIAHRVVKTKENASKIYFNTKGDANNSIDNELVNEDEVLGVVIRVVKYIGYPTVWINGLFGR